MKKRVFASVVLTLLLSAAAFAQKINTDYDRSANFSNYHTYMWEKSPHPARGFWDQRITDGVDKELQAKGLTKVDANPDVGWCTATAFTTRSRSSAPVTASGRRGAGATGAGERHLQHLCHQAGHAGG